MFLLLHRWKNSRTQLEGGRRLNPQMAKVVAGQVATLPVDQVVREFLARVGGKAQKSGPGFYTAGQDRQ